MTTRRALRYALTAALVLPLTLGHSVSPAGAASPGTASAKGNGQVARTQECSAGDCVTGGGGAMFSFDFSGPGPGTAGAVPATGTFSVKFRESGNQADFVTGTATIFTDFHSLQVSGTCTVTTAAGTTPLVECSLFAQDNASPSEGDDFFFSYFTPDFATFWQAFSPVISGGMQID